MKVFQWVVLSRFQEQVVYLIDPLQLACVPEE